MKMDGSLYTYHVKKTRAIVRRKSRTCVSFFLFFFSINFIFGSSRPYFGRTKSKATTMKCGSTYRKSPVANVVGLTCRHVTTYHVRNRPRLEQRRKDIIFRPHVLLLRPGRKKARLAGVFVHHFIFPTLSFP